MYVGSGQHLVRLVKVEMAIGGLYFYLTFLEFFLNIFLGNIGLVFISTCNISSEILISF